MKRIFAVTAILAATPSLAQPAPQTVAVPADVLQATIGYLQTGGTHTEGALLAQRIIDAAQEPAKKAAVQKEKDDAVATALANTKKP